MGRSTLVVMFAMVRLAHADDGRLLDDDTFAVRSNGGLSLDGGLVVAMPSALPAGISEGFALGVTRECGCLLSYGVRASWSTATESTEAWTVNQQDVRLRVTGALRHAFGRGTLALRLGVGPTLVYEDRTRNQGMRAGLTGTALETRALAALPAADLEAMVALHVSGPWLVVASGGPSVDWLSSAFHTGWIAQLGIGWQP